MNRGSWNDLALLTGEATPWKQSSDEEARRIKREALRYCPEFPFSPAVDQTFEKTVSFYDDYRLVRLAPAAENEASPVSAEVYGFFAPGDFRPLDALGRTVEELNKIVPLSLTKESIVDYALLRLRCELAWRLFTPNQFDSSWRLAKIVSKFSDLPLDNETVTDEVHAELEHLLVAPHFTEGTVSASDQIKQYHVHASAVVVRNTEWALLRTSMDVSVDGSLTWHTDPEKPKWFPLKSPRVLPRVSLLLRTRSALPICEWHKLRSRVEDSDLPDILRNKIGPKISDWDKMLRTKYGIGTNPNVRRVILRVANLAFYKSFCLLEALEKLADGYRRSYALIRYNEGMLDVRPLNGKSNVIHKINSEDDKPTIMGRNADEYLRFFCWAIHAEGGAFYIPRELREVTFKSAPHPDQLARLRELLSSNTISNVGPENQLNVADAVASAGNSDAPAGPDDRLNVADSAVMREQRHATVFYSTAMFEARFDIELTGKVDLVSDKPRVTDLAIDTETSGENDLFILTVLRPKPSHYLQRSDDILLVSEQKQIINSNDFYKLTSTDGGSARCDVNERIVMGDSVP